jgi:hypothetical protein
MNTNGFCYSTIEGLFGAYMNNAGAWSCGRYYSLLSSEQSKAEYILAFDDNLRSEFDDEADIETLQDAFAMGANGLPFSEVKKG